MNSTTQELTYKTIADRELKIDIFAPETTEHTRTAIIMVHGGGWKRGDRSMMHLFGPELAGQGFVVFAPQYRLLGEAPWPAQLEDVKSAIRWVRANAEQWNIDPDKIALEGFSAGGHLALLASGTGDSSLYSKNDNPEQSDVVNAVVAFFPPIEMTTGEPDAGMTPAQVLLGEQASAEQAREVSPLHQVHPGFPPTFLLHGNDDHIVPHITSMRMAAALEGQGVDVELHIYPRHTHEFVRLPSMMSLTHQEIGSFLRRMLVDPQKYEQEERELGMFPRPDK